MANAVFIANLESTYDDVLEQRYHFSSRYLTRAQQTIGDWIIYYEPRRNGGRCVYFAMAQVVAVDPDPRRAGHYYARLQGYQEFAESVGLQHAGRYLESFLRNPDGSLNNGAAINAVRILPPTEFHQICQLGLLPALTETVAPSLLMETDLVAETQSEFAGTRRRANAARPVRDAAFRLRVRDAYDRTCAMTGLRLVNEDRSEVEAAHIRPVEADGPDSARNGLALCRTVHWLFDQGMLSVEDNGDILQTRRGIPDSVRRLINADGKIRLPTVRVDAPHALFLRWHRENRFRG